MGRLRVAAAIVMLALVASLAACCGGSTTVEKTVEKTPVNVQTQTTGDQLIDLQKAYQSGAINEQQYNKMKQDIIDKSGEK
jgi:iron-sulfur cluster repair protein YtfE (RIC family)